MGHSLVGVCDLFGVHATEEKERKGRDGHAKETKRKVSMNLEMHIRAIDVREDLAECPSEGDREEVGLHEDLGEEEGDN